MTPRQQRRRRRRRRQSVTKGDLLLVVLIVVDNGLVYRWRCRCGIGFLFPSVLLPGGRSGRETKL